MPFPNEHAARQADPRQFTSFRRGRPPGFPKGIDVVWGIRSNGKTEIQTLRFDASKWSVDEAKKWLKDHGMKVGSFEPASKPVSKGFWSDVL